MVNAQRLRRDVATIGASAGGVGALQALLTALPPDHPGLVTVVMHRSPFFESTLPAVLSRRTLHTVVEPGDADPITSGRIYLAPRDRHMVVDDSVVRLSRGPKEHHTRPAIDPLFHSVARVYGTRVVGVILTGGGDDGVDGLIAIKAAGGISIAQDPDEAEHPWMPQHAMVCDRVDLVLPITDIARALYLLAKGCTFPSLPSQDAEPVGSVK